MTELRPERWVCAAAALAWSLAVVPGCYAVLRMAQHAGGCAPGIFFGPSLLAGVAILVGLSGGVFAVAWRWFVLEPESCGRWLRVAVLGSAALLVAQGVLLP